MEPRACWPVLAKKAQEKVEEKQQHLAAARQHLERLQANRQRLQDMYESYRLKAKEKMQQIQVIAEAANDRQFMAHLLQLIERVDADLNQATIAVEQSRQAMLLAEQERMKMDTMVEKDQQAVRTFQRKREQKQMDALGITLFNLKT